MYLKLRAGTSELFDYPHAFLKPGREKSLLRRHRSIFDQVVERVQGDPASGQTVAVRSAKGEFLAQAAAQALKSSLLFGPGMRMKPLIPRFSKIELRSRLRAEDYLEGATTAVCSTASRIPAASPCGCSSSGPSWAPFRVSKPAEVCLRAQPDRTCRRRLQGHQMGGLDAARIDALRAHRWDRRPTQ